jgi:hypothetical protein
MMRRITCLVAMAVLASLFVFVGVSSAQSSNALQNGDFEAPFADGVAPGWSAFNNLGSVVYAYAATTDPACVFSGAQAQALDMHTRSVGGSQADRWTGIYQTVDVVAGTEYLFNIYGALRTTEGSAEHSRWNYRVQVGLSPGAGTDPGKVREWTDLPWDPTPLDGAPPFAAYSQPVVATSDQMTVFVRLFKKFPTIGQEAVLTLDAASLLGPAPDDPLAGVTMLPQTGLGDAATLAGLASGLLALGLTARRLRKSPADTEEERPRRRPPGKR